MMKRFVIKSIDFYRKYLSLFKLPSCRYFPTCSQYAKDTIEKYGVGKGFLKAAYRILHCHPFSKGGFDPA